MKHAVLAIIDGYVAANEMYTLGEIKQRLGLGAHALRTARRRGLRILHIGRSDFVLGKDLIQFAQEMNQESIRNRH
jgi:hypothetical protein